MCIYYRLAQCSKGNGFDRAMKDYRLPIHLVLIFLLGVLVYSNSLGGPFVLDDLESITNNESIRSLGNFLPGLAGGPFQPRPGLCQRG